MSEPRRDPYEVLRVPRDANARAVKSAYFALVREFPPETHPAEFQELRDAYDVLSDPQRRAQLDASHDVLAGLGAEQAALLQAAHHAFASDDAQGGEQLLRRLIADDPALLVAREQLGMALLRRQAWDEAVACWDELVKLDGKNPRYHLHLGWAHRKLSHAHRAVVCHRRALELGGGDEARAALADALDDAHQWEEAVAVLDEGIAAAGAVPPPVLIRRKVAFLLLHGAARRGWKAFDNLAASLQGREAERAAHADELASLAAWLFANKQQRLANELLRRLGSIDPGRRPDRLLPERSTIDVATLPPASVDWLEGKIASPRRIVQGQQGRFRSLLALGPGVLLAWWSLYLWQADGLWDGERLFWSGVVFCGAAGALAFGGLRFHLALTARLPILRLIHPVYYLEVDFDRVRAYPLVNLHDVNIVRHSTNGVYTHTMLHLPFGNRVRRITFRRPEHASELANALLERRHRVLELLANGLLETEEGIDLLPAELLAAGARGGYRRPLALAGGALAAALLALGAAVIDHGWASLERLQGDQALGSADPAALLAFAASQPSRAVEARPQLAAWVKGLEEGPGALSPRPQREVALTLARALAGGAPNTLALEVSFAPADAAVSLAADGAGAPLQCAAPSLREQALLTRALQDALDRTLGERTIRVVSARAAGAAVLTVSITPRPAGIFRSGEAGLPAVRAVALDWATVLRLPGGATHEARGSVPPPDRLTLPASWRGAVTREEACASIGGGAELAEVARAVARALGLDVPRVEVKP